MIDDEDDHFIINTGNVGIGNGAGNIVVPTGSATYTYTIGASQGLVNANGSLISSTTTTTKKSVLYLIVDKSGACFELQEQNPVTPREMIGICKFLTAVQRCASVQMDWMALVHGLGIQRHFIMGKRNHSEYTDPAVLYIKLMSQ